MSPCRTIPPEKKDVMSGNSSLVDQSANLSIITPGWKSFPVHFTNSVTAHCLVSFPTGAG